MHNHLNFQRKYEKEPFAALRDDKEDDTRYDFTEEE